MICNKCGKEIADGVVFCAYCGSVVSQPQLNQVQMQQQINQQQVNQQPFYYQQQVPYVQSVSNQEPENNGKKKRKGLIIGLIVTAVVLLACVVAIVIFVLFKNKDKNYEAAEIVVSSYEQGFEMLIEALNEDNYELYETICYDNEIRSEEYFEKLCKATVDAENDDIYKPELMVVIDSTKLEPISAEDFMGELISEDDVMSEISDYAMIYAGDEDAENGINVVIAKFDDEWKIIEFK